MKSGYIQFTWALRTSVEPNISMCNVISYTKHKMNRKYWSENRTMVSVYMILVSISSYTIQNPQKKRGNNENMMTKRKSKSGYWINTESHKLWSTNCKLVPSLSKRYTMLSVHCPRSFWNWPKENKGGWKKRKEKIAIYWIDKFSCVPDVSFCWSISFLEFRE